jgi:hypothetical protein
MEGVISSYALEVAGSNSLLRTMIAMCNCGNVTQKLRNPGTLSNTGSLRELAITRKMTLPSEDFSKLSGHSILRARIGSTEAARRAGT